MGGGGGPEVGRTNSLLVLIATAADPPTTRDQRFLMSELTKLGVVLKKRSGPGPPAWFYLSVIVL